ncbi:MAG: hypothetical protein ALAOOOJD_01090 [bacterium]|nr:hypothetical protein [bacterium]
MRKRDVVAAVLLGAFGIILFFLLASQTSWRAPAPQGTGNVAKVTMKHEKSFVDKEKGKKADRPDLFYEFHRDIRTGYGETEPSYPMNYQIAELLKARGVTSTQALSKASRAPLPWIERGPGNVAGRTRSILIDPADPTFNTWILGSVSGGVWKTTNAGNSWQELTKGLTNLATSTLAMAASNPNVIYAGTGEGFSNSDQVSGNGVWKSTDRGQTWQQLASTVNNTFRHVTRVIVDPQNENVVLVSTAGGFRSEGANGIYRSTDGGQNWTPVYNATSRVQQLIVNPKNFKTQYASVNATAILKSVDGGVTWTPSLSGLAGVSRMELAIAPTDTSRLYVSAESSPARFYASNDGGANWILAQPEDAGVFDFLGGQGWYDNTIAVHPYDANSVLVGAVGVWKFTMKSGRAVLGTDFENTQSFLAFQNTSGQLAGGGIVFGNVAAANQPSLEIRFGPGKKQKAHRFTVPSGATTGVPNANYAYQDYVDVPFEVWDIDNNRQLMVSFRDQTANGQFELEVFNTNRSREYIYPQLETYNAAAPSPNIAKAGGHTYQQLYFIWPILAANGVWNPNGLPNSTLRIRWGNSPTGTVARNIFVDVYRQFGGSPKGVHPDQHHLLFVPTNPAQQQFRLLIGNDGGLAYSDDGGITFNQTGQGFNIPGALKGYNTSQFYGLDKMNGGDRYIGGTQDNGSYFSGENPDAASEWAHAPSGDGFEAAWHYGDPNKILESSQFNNIYRSLDRGVTWQSVRPPGGTGTFITKIAKSKQDPDLVFATAAGGIVRSDNFASDWTVTTMPTGFVGSNTFSQVEISLASPQVVWAGHTMTTTVAPFVSTDGGLSFSAAKNIGRNLGSLTGIATHPTEEKTAYALFAVARQPKILRTTDLGQTWTELSGFGTNTTSSNGFPDVATFCLLVMPYDTNILWAGTEIGIFESKDGGNTWAYADNGLPPVTIWEMTIVNDEVAVATHGRGIWSVSLPQLAGYKPPVTTLSPRFREIGGGYNGVISTVVGLASPYDSTFVFVDGAKYFRFSANAAAKDTALTLLVPLSAPKTVKVSLMAYRGGKVFLSGENSLELQPLKSARLQYNNDFNNAAGAGLDFSTSGLTFSTAAAFANGALNSPHNYGNSQNYTATLLTPIIVASANAMLIYDDVALVEPGEPGSKFGEEEFYDYVVVEGSNDFGKTWKPLAPGYDARDDPRWLAAYDASQSGTPAMFKNHTVNLLQTFPAGAQILIRFRLFADAGTAGWGWLVDNLLIQPNATSVTSQTAALPSEYNLAQNYPNPFNPSTKIKYALPQNSAVQLVVYNASGQKVRTLVDAARQAAGYHEIIWNGANDVGQPVASGVYFYKLTAGNYVRALKMLVVK